MELKEFVKETLIQVTDGIKEAQEECIKKGGLINPMLENPISNDTCFKVDDKYYPATSVRYKVGLTESAGRGSEKGIGVFLSAVSMGAKEVKDSGIQSITSMEFSVNVVFPYINRKGEHVPIEGIFY